MSEELSSPDERILQIHLESGRFRSGVAAGWWRLVSLDWPYVVVGVMARDGIEYGFRFHCVRITRTQRLPPSPGIWKTTRGCQTTYGQRAVHGFPACLIRPGRRVLASTCRATVSRLKDMGTGTTNILLCCGTLKRVFASIWA